MGPREDFVVQRTENYLVDPGLSTGSTSLDPYPLAGGNAIDTGDRRQFKLHAQ